jgi:ABC-type multidrug transport system fused ATPase/permease subunit
MNVPSVLWSFARPHRGKLAFALLLALMGSAMGLATPMVTKWVLDSLNERAGLGGPVIALITLLLAGLVIWWCQWILLGSLGERVVLEARESMVRRLFRATVPAITSRKPGELVTRVTSDTVLLREAASSSVIGLVNGVVMLVGTLVMMSVLDLVLLGTTVAAVASVTVLFAVLMPAIAKAHEQSQEHIGRLGGTLEAAIRAIRTVKVSRAEDRLAERILDDARESTRHSIRGVKREATAWSIAWSGVQMAIILVLAVGAYRVSLGALEVSSLIAFLLYAFGLMEPITELSQNFTTLQAGVAAAKRIKEIDALDTETLTAQDSPAIEFCGVTAGYGNEPAVRDIDLKIPEQGHTAIVGPSGAGKTTLFSLMLQFLEPQQGVLHTRTRGRIAYVEQETPVVPGTIGDNVRFSHPDATDDEVRQVLREVRLHELEDALDSELSSTNVSGGQRQRIALARAILRTPDVLLLDEATAQVDGLTESAIHDCIRSRAREAAVVTIAHRLSTVLDADTIVVMEDGRIRARGTHEQLLASDELYRSLVEALRIGELENA